MKPSPYLKQHIFKYLKGGIVKTLLSALFVGSFALVPVICVGAVAMVDCTCPAEISGGRVTIVAGKGIQENPAVAVDSRRGNYYTLWTQQEPNQVGGLPLEVMGRLLGSTGTPMSSVTTLDTQGGTYLAVAYTPADDSFLALWFTGLFVQSPKGQFIGHDGIPRGDPFDIPELTGVPLRMVHNDSSNEFAVLFTDRPRQSARVLLLRLNKNGKAVGKATVVNHSPADNPNPDLAYNSAKSEYLVSWVGGSFGQPQPIRYQILSASLHLMGPNKTASVGEVTAPLLAAFDPIAHRYALMWNDNSGSQLRLVSEDGVISSPVIDLPLAIVNKMAANPETGGFVVLLFGDNDITMARLNSDGGVVDVGVPMACRVWPYFEGPLVYNAIENEFLMTWTKIDKLFPIETTGDIFARRVKAISTTGKCAKVITVSFFHPEVSRLCSEAHSFVPGRFE